MSTLKVDSEVINDSVILLNEVLDYLCQDTSEVSTELYYATRKVLTKLEDVIA